MRLFSRGILMLAALVLGMASHADAGYLLFDNPNPIVTLPASGSATIILTGRVSLDAGYFSQFYANPAFVSDGAGHFVSPNFVGTNGAFTAPNNGGVYSGPLLAITYSAGFTPGVYRFTNTTTSLASFSVSGYNGTSNESFSSNFSLTILPEPASLVMMGLGLTGVSMVARRRRASV